ncbi:hypothetical protein HO173_005769 [Letharia columbiana]|uniref:Heterokaryon incompatibility domain-containing protein n=1 Tax=Letharia columbiana TaxID=112416 RepID=A0A8H6FWM1_9LECA|nr:uncharacterized protein HO173_005769 [Letharia columbiana]KAF6236140.1 hypothetical protein HO173_005769 [Letharia columbiana]
MIRLLDATTHSVASYLDPPSYAIISHVWLFPEIIHTDIIDPSVPLSTFTNPSHPKRISAAKILNSCNTLVRLYNGRVKHLWLDTICIDKRDLTELSTAINTMYKWYKYAEVCFVYLADYPSPSVSDFTHSKWFTRGWTLQELIAPKSVLFFDASWNRIGDRDTLKSDLTARTSIPAEFLLGSRNVGWASVSCRMSWAAGRTVTVEEDIAYCLLGLFGVNMPLLYGEGAERAFRRLQEEIMRYSDDHSLFAWKSQNAGSFIRGPRGVDVLSSDSGLLAASPDYFASTREFKHAPSRENNRPFAVTNKGIYIDLYLQWYGHEGLYVASIECKHGPGHYLGIFLKCIDEETQQFWRARPEELVRVVASGRGQLRGIYVKPPDDLSFSRIA